HNDTTFKRPANIFRADLWGRWSGRARLHPHSSPRRVRASALVFVLRHSVSDSVWIVCQRGAGGASLPVTEEQTSAANSVAGSGNVLCFVRVGVYLGAR